MYLEFPISTMRRSQFLRFLLLLPSTLLLPGCNKSEQGIGNGTGGDAEPNEGKKLAIAFMPKSKGNGYFINCEKGAREAAKELGVDLLFDGPANTDPAKQSEMIESWITLGVDVIAIACENKEGISSTLKKAQENGIKVITYDSDTIPEARSFFVSQATAPGIGEKLMDEAARLCGAEGDFAIITGTLTSANMNEWRKHIEARLSTAYPKMRLVDTKPCDDQRNEAQEVAAQLLRANPELKCIMAISSPAVLGAAEAVKQAGKAGTVHVMGLGLPSESRGYLKDGSAQSVILWKVADLGYLTMHAAHALGMGTLKVGDRTFKAGRLGELPIDDSSTIILGSPFVFHRDNVDQFDF
jgi:ABC-type sugar transport system substrate-binding protein